MSNPDAFCLWLRGFVELDGSHPTPEQWECIKQHLDLVFTKVTPPVAGSGTVGSGYDKTARPTSLDQLSKGLKATIASDKDTIILC